MITKVSPDGDKVATADNKKMPLRAGHCLPHRGAALHLGVARQPTGRFFTGLQNPQAMLEVSPQGDEGAGDYVRRDDARQIIQA